MKRGLFLVFEGVEGSGKSTQASWLTEWLVSRGVPAALCREPGGTALGEEIRALVLEGGEVPPRSELLLMLAARAVFVDEVVRPRLEEGQVVIADRYELSTYAYQGYGRGLPLEEVRRLNEFATGGLRPDLTLVLDVPLSEGEARRTAAGRSSDRIERAGTAFHERVGEAYRLLAEQEPDVEVIDGLGSPEVVQSRILDRLRRRYPETFAHALG
jgi:dTMP kinase